MEWQQREKRVLAGKREDSPDHSDLRAEVSVGEHDTLGCAGTARRENDRREALAIGRRWGGDFAAEDKRPGQLRQVELGDPGDRIANAAAQSLRDFGGNQSGPRLRDLANWDQLLGRNQMVERHRYSSGEYNREIRQYPVRGILGNQQDPITRLDPAL